MTTDRPPKISCLLPAYNAAEFLAEAVDSVLSQTEGDFELIVVDDGSTDATAQILSDIAGRDARVRILRQPNAGIVAALNAGLAACRGVYVARMDADDVSLPHRFAEQAAYLDAHDDCVLVGGLARTLRTDGALGGVTTGGRHAVTDLASFPPKVAVAMHPLIMVRRAALDAIGGYRAHFPHAEDYDLYLRLAPYGRFHNPAREMLLYRRHDNAISLRHLEQQERSAALAEFDAVAPGEAAPAFLLEPYVRLRIWRRYRAIDPAKAGRLLSRLARDCLNPAPPLLMSRRYWGLRTRIVSSVGSGLLRTAVARFRARQAKLRLRAA